MRLLLAAKGSLTHIFISIDAFAKDKAGLKNTSHALAQLAAMVVRCRRHAVREPIPATGPPPGVFNRL